MFPLTRSSIYIKSSVIASDPICDRIGARAARRPPIIFVAAATLVLLLLSHVALLGGAQAQQCTLKTSRFLGDSCYTSDDCHFGLLCDGNVCRDMVPYMLDRYVNITRCAIADCYASVSNYPTSSSTQ